MNIITDSYAKGKTHMRYLVALIFFLTFSHQASAQDVQTLLTEAQRDFIRGDRAAAKEKFTIIQKTGSSLFRVGKIMRV